MAMTTFGMERDEQERQDALRLLLRHPLVTADGPHAEGFELVRRHRDALAGELRQVFGYRLVVEPGFARLYKAGLGPDRPRPLHRASGVPFSPRAYAYLALCCAVLLTSRQQVLLSSLVEQVRHAATEAGLPWGDDSMADRRAFVAAVRSLVELGVLVEDDGSVAAFADNADAEALLFVRRELVRHLLAVPLREVESPDELVHLAVSPSLSGGARHRVRRLLVEEPAVVAGDVDEESWAWLRQSQRREAVVLGELIGLQLEIRAEGVAAIDPRDELTDVAFPRGGTLGHAALLTIAELANAVRPAPRSADAVVAWAPVPDGALGAVVHGLLARHGRRWRNEYVQHPERLVADVEDLLVAMRLLRRRDGALELSAVARRYAPAVDEPPARVTPSTLDYDEVTT
jgi:uncharacterized protein (TIGR02678 family)